MSMNSLRQQCQRVELNNPTWASGVFEVQGWVEGKYGKENLQFMDLGDTEDSRPPQLTKPYHFIYITTIYSQL